MLAARLAPWSAWPACVKLIDDKPVTVRAIHVSVCQEVRVVLSKMFVLMRYLLWIVRRSSAPRGDQTECGQNPQGGQGNMQAVARTNPPGEWIGDQPANMR